MRSLMHISKREIILPFYHTVSDMHLSHLTHLYPVLSVQRFTEDLDFLLKYYQPIDHQQLIDHQNGTNPLHQPSFFLSFDDGLAECEEIIAPILLQKGIPATFFLNTAFIDNKDMFFRLKTSLLMERMHHVKMTDNQILSIKSILAPYSISFEQALDLKKITYTNRHILEDIALVLSVNFQSFLHEYKPYLSSEQIQSLINQGFNIGSHSVDHAYFPELSEDEQVNQVLQSVRFLKDNFGVDSRMFSFPFTDFNVNVSFFERIKSEVDVSFGTSNLKKDCICTNLQRIPMELPDKDNAEQIITDAYLRFIAKMLLGKQTIQRS